MRLKALLLASLLAGCGSSSDQVVTGTAPVTSIPPTQATPVDALQLAKLSQISNITRFAPQDHLDGQRVRPKGEVGAADAPLNTTVQELELGYDTTFGSLSQTLGVTNSTSQVQGNINFIANQSQTGFFNLNRAPIANNTLGVTSVHFEPITYNTTVALPTGSNTVQVSGGLLMPLGINATQVKGVVLYFHGTTFSKAQVPSNWQGNIETQLLAQVFASQGYIVAAPDYIGQGVDWQNVHPYVLYPKVSAQTAVDLLNAIQPVIAAQYNLPPLTSGVATPPLKLFSTGYSEGGAYALWFNTYLATSNSTLSPRYRFTHAVGMEGAYSCSNVIFNYLFDDVSPGDGNPFNVQTRLLVNVVKPLLAADALLSYATYTVGGVFSNVFQNEFFAMNATGLDVSQNDCSVNVSGTLVHDNIQQAFYLPDTDISSPLLYSGLNKRGNGDQYVGKLGLLFESDNSAKSLVSSTLLGAGNQTLTSTMQAADVNLSQVADRSCSIISLDQDSVVVPNNFDWLAANFPTKLLNQIKVPHASLMATSTVSKPGFVLWEPVDHLHGLIYEYLYALNIFNSF